MAAHADVRFGARALASAAALALVAIPFALLLFLVQGRWDPLLDVDEAARDGLHTYALDHAWFVTLAKVISFVGSAWVGVPLFTLVAVWLVRRLLPRLALFVVVTVAGSSLLNALAKLLVDRARPVLPDPVAHASGLSFPSGHAQSAVVWAGVLLLVFAPMLEGRRRVVAIAAAVCWVLAVGFARVALGVHFVSDVIAGYVLGAAWVIAMAAAFNAWRVERGHPPVDPDDGLEPGVGTAA
jgi:membrane-associated phospholipid phosphatase